MIECYHSECPYHDKYEPFCGEDECYVPIELLLTERIKETA